MLHHTLLRVDVAERSMLRRGYRLLYYTLRGVNTHRINVDSAALTLNTLFALVPLLTLVLLILGKLGVFERYVAVIYAGAPQDWHFVLDRLVATATAAAENIVKLHVLVPMQSKIPARILQQVCLILCRELCRFHNLLFIQFQCIHLCVHLFSVLLAVLPG